MPRACSNLYLGVDDEAHHRQRHPLAFHPCRDSDPGLPGLIMLALVASEGFNPAFSEDWRRGIDEDHPGTD